MPTLGTGVMPSGSIGNELSYVTRRAFIPKLVVQIYNATPLAAALLSNNKTATGGVSSITQPVQGASMVAGQWVGPDGSFQTPAIMNGIQNAEWNLKGLAVPIANLGFESLLQQGHAVIDLMAARMNDVGNVYADVISTALYGNYNNNQQILGLAAAVDDGTNLVTYAGVNRNTNPWWKAKRYSASAAYATRATVMQYITGTFKNCGEIPDFGVMGPATWQGLANDFIGQENYQILPGQGFDKDSTGPRAGFRALMVAGVPIYMDPYCPEGSLYLLNTGYMAMHIHQNANFAFTGFESTLPNMQIGHIGAVVTLLEMVNVKPKTSTIVTGFTYPTI